MAAPRRGLDVLDSVLQPYKVLYLIQVTENDMYRNIGTFFFYKKEAEICQNKRKKIIYGVYSIAK